MEDFLFQFLGILLGGILAISGGVLTIWFQARSARKIKIDEIVAEKKITANAEAFAYVKKIQSMLIQFSSKDVLKEILSLEEWWLKSRLFLPGKFINKWLGLREGASKLARLEASASINPEEAVELQKELDRLANEALKEIYNDMNLEEIKVDSPKTGVKPTKMLARKRCPACGKKEDPDGRCKCTNQDAW